MRALLIPIPEKIISRIISHKQRYLFRRCAIRQGFDRVICFTPEPSPTTVLELLPGPVEDMMRGQRFNHFFRFSAMQQSEWDAYWFGCTKPHAIEICEFALQPLDKRFNPVEYWRLKQAPQNFCYVPSPNWPLGHPYELPTELFGKQLSCL